MRKRLLLVALASAVGLWAQSETGRAGLQGTVVRWERFVMTDAPLSPFKIGRQPSRS